MSSKRKQEREEYFPSLLIGAEMPKFVKNFPPRIWKYLDKKLVGMKANKNEMETENINRWRQRGRKYPFEICCESRVRESIQLIRFRLFMFWRHYFPSFVPWLYPFLLVGRRFIRFSHSPLVRLLASLSPPFPPPPRSPHAHSHVSGVFSFSIFIPRIREVLEIPRIFLNLLEPSRIFSNLLESSRIIPLLDSPPFTSDSGRQDSNAIDSTQMNWFPLLCKSDSCLYFFGCSWFE